MSSQSWASRTSLDSVEEATFFYQDWDVQKAMVARLCREIWPLARDFELDLICDWSSFNRVIGIDVTEDDDIVYRYVLRIPRPTNKFLRQRDGAEVVVMEEVGNCVATLKYLENNTPISAPQVVCFDKTEQNCLGYPYVIMTRIPGKCLHFVLGKLTQEQRLQLAREIGQLLRIFQACRSPLAGTIREADGTKNGCERGEDVDVGVVPLGAIRSSTALPLVIGSAAGPERLSDEDSQNLTAKQILVKAFEHRTAQLETQKQNLPAEYLRGWFEDLTDRLSRAFEWDWIDDDYGNSLFHNDFYPRNIMVDPETTPMITGVVDWDDAMFLPKFMTCAPPGWLITPDDPSSEQKLGSQAFVPKTPDQLAIKKAFDEGTGEEFAQNVYNERHILMRAVAQIALVSNWDYMTLWDYTNCEEEWRRQVNVFHEELGLSSEGGRGHREDDANTDDSETDDSETDDSETPDPCDNSG